MPRFQVFPFSHVHVTSGGMQLSFLHLISNLNCFLVPFHFEREAGVSSSRRFTADKACEKTGQSHNNHKNLAAASLRLACSGVGSLKSLDSIILSHLYTIRLRITPRSLHYLVTHINHTRFDIVINLLSRLHEGLEMKPRNCSDLLDVGRSLGRGLQEDQTVLLSKLGALFGRHGSATYYPYWLHSPVVQIRLVADQHNHHVGGSVLTRLGQPLRQLSEGFTAGNIVHKKGSSSSSVVGTSDGAEGLLTSLSHYRQSIRGIQYPRSEALPACRQC